MNLFMKALTAMRHAGRAPFLLGTLARTRFDYAREVGDGLDSSVVTAPVQWMQRAVPEARLRIVRLERRGTGREEIEGHPLAQLIARPNPFYSGADLLAATVLSYLVAGNAYWLKVTNNAGRPVELWYAPHWTLSPKWPTDGSDFISHFEYRPGGASAAMRLEPEDVVHFRHGIDPRNPRLGISPLHGCIREIFMDLESSNFVASLLRNLGVPGMVLSPEGGAQATPEDVAAVKTWLAEAFSGDRRGSALVLGASAKVQQYGFTPQQMDLSVARDVAEERVCAALGIPAAVVGFGAGLQTAKVGATMGELRKLAWTNGVLPMLRAFAATLDRALLPDFENRPELFEVDFDAGDVVALEQDMLARAQRFDAMVRGGWAEVAEAREALGLDVDDSHRIYLRPFSVLEVPAGSAPRPLPAPDSSSATAAALDLRGKLGRRLGEDGKQPLSAEALAKADRARRTLAQGRYVLALERLEKPLSRALAAHLIKFFTALGEAAAAAARPLLESEAPPKQSGEDQVLALSIIEQLELPLHRAAFQQLYEAHYLEVAKKIAKAGKLIGLATDLPDPVARAVVAAGGRRSGLIDLSKQARASLFDALAEGRAAGEGVDQLSRRIRDRVAAGPWGGAETRARTIARTETKFAQNISTVARARHEGVERFVVFDGRLGEGVSDPEHIARDGIVVTAAEAEAMAAAEHPNGTLSLSPYIGEEE